MIGSVITALACFLTFILGDYTSLLLFYGLLSGLGFAMINMGCLLVVGFYFHKWRAMAFTIAITGSSIGVIFFSLLYTETTQTIGWQYTVLLQASVTGLCYFFAFAYRPLFSMTVVQTTILKTDLSDAKLKSISILNTKSVPVLSKILLKPSETFRRISTDEDGREEGITGGLFSADTNVKFPTAAEVINEIAVEILGDASVPDLASSSNFVSRLTLIANNTPFYEHDLDEIKTLLVEAISKANLREGETAVAPTKSSLAISIMPHEEINDEGDIEGRRESVIKGVFHWEEHVAESRPLYRDDAFLHHITQPDNEEIVENPIEYQLKVSRVAAAGDLKERRGIFTTAFKRVLATMLHPKLLERKSFISICLSMLLFYSGYLVPLIFVTDRGKEFGISLDWRKWFLSAVGFSGIFGRFIISFLVAKISPMKLTVVCHFVAGVCTVVSCFLPLAEYQIAYCLVFGLTTAGTSIMRSLILVRLYGLENLTNCTGMVFLFQGFGCLFSPPLAGALIKLHDKAPFIYAGASLIGSAILIIPLSRLVDNENKAATRADKPEDESDTQIESKTLTKLVEIEKTDNNINTEFNNEPEVDDKKSDIK